jgi:hypothetical protein
MTQQGRQSRGSSTIVIEPGLGNIYSNTVCGAADEPIIGALAVTGCRESLWALQGTTARQVPWQSSQIIKQHDLQQLRTHELWPLSGSGSPHS